MSNEATDPADRALFGWKLRDGAPEGTCDSCSELQLLRYEWPETEAWLCAECWHDATEIDRLKAEVERLRQPLPDGSIAATYRQQLEAQLNEKDAEVERLRAENVNLAGQLGDEARTWRDEVERLRAELAEAQSDQIGAIIERTILEVEDDGDQG